MLGSVSALFALSSASWFGFAAWRFYRRFLFETPEGRVWGVADDVYISACFGRSLFTGDGFLWYPGAPPVEGISNPLWSVLIGALHVLPGFSEDRLGAYVLALNVALLTALCALFWNTLRRTQPQPSPTLVLALVPFPLVASVSYWSAEGFEIGLLAVLAFALLRLALEPVPNSRRAGLFGLLLAAGIATRMDFVLLAIPALLVLALRSEPRRTLFALASAALLVAALLVARYAYYGAWLPNTYWLKATGWPLAPRLRAGLHQNWALLAVVPLPWLPLVHRGLRRHILEHAPAALPACAGFAASVLYSTYLGGDSWGLFAGYDRHTAVGGLLLLWGLGSVIASFGTRWIASGVTCGVACVLLALPVVGSDLERAVNGVLSAEIPTRNLERDWIAYGKAFRTISRPGARIAICPAGAIVYFSHRGGVDLLGKVDPFVARLPVSLARPKNSICWRNAPGHNKEDDLRTFELRVPEFSRHRPPSEVRERYVKLKFNGMVFFSLRDNPYHVES